MHFEWNDILLLLRLVLDILLVWGLVYAGIRIIRNNNRTVQILKGILAVFLIKLTAMVLNLQGANFLIGIFLNWGVILVMIILQPEIRGMLEKMGKTNVLFAPTVPAARTMAMIDELMSAVENMSRSKTGALITLQMNQSMQDYEETGIPMDSDVSSELLETIFQYGTPMHDGAVIIEGDKIATAAAYYPSTSRDLPSKYGARHRAAVGISEVTDSITLVVSEETGNISVANRGVLTQYSPQALRRFLTNKLVPEENPENTSVLTPVINTVRSYSNQLRPVKNNSGTNPQKARSDDRVKPMEVVDMRPEVLKKEAQNNSHMHGGRRTGHDTPQPAAQPASNKTSKPAAEKKGTAAARRNERSSSACSHPQAPASAAPQAQSSSKAEQPSTDDSKAPAVRQQISGEAPSQSASTTPPAAVQDQPAGAAESQRNAVQASNPVKEQEPAAQREGSTVNTSPAASGSAAADTDLRSSGQKPDDQSPSSISEPEPNASQEEENEAVMWRKSQSVLDCQNAGISQGMHTRYSSSLKAPDPAFASSDPAVPDPSSADAGSRKTTGQDQGGNGHVG